MQHDVFVSHASEDKEAFVAPLAKILSQLGLKVWYDEFSLKLGDSLSRSIDKGLSESTFGIVVLKTSCVIGLRAILRLLTCFAVTKMSQKFADRPQKAL